MTDINPDAYYELSPQAAQTAEGSPGFGSLYQSGQQAINWYQQHGLPVPAGIDPNGYYALSPQAAQLALQTPGFGNLYQSGGEAINWNNINGTTAPGAPQTPGPGGDTGIGNAPTGNQLSSSQADAWAQLQQTLASYGFSGADLQNLINFAKQEIISGNSNSQIMLDLEQTPEFARRFPAIVQRRQAGLPPVTPAEYLSLEDSYAQLERAAGIPPNFASYDQLIANDVSPTEYSDRINQGYLAVAQANPDVVKQFQDYYGVAPGQLAAYFLNPEKAAPLLQRQAVAAQLGAAGHETGFGQLGESEAMRLAREGVTYQQGLQGLGQLAQQHQLYQNTLPGQHEQALTQDQLLSGQFEQNAQVQRTLARQAAYEKGTTSQGGKVGETSAGFTGIGRLQR